jgi:succinoglycan biosynthesis transport protein ExoP
MDDELEIDLRKVIRNLLRRWTWIVGVALLAGLAAFAFTFLQPRRYEASAVIALTRPLNLPNFDPRYETMTNPLTINNKIVNDVALGDEVVQLLFEQWNEPEKEPTDLQAFVNNSLKVESGQDATIAILKVRLKDPQEATRLAKLWAEEVVQRINLTYSGRDKSQVVFFQEQVTTAEQRVQAAAQALEEFEAQNQRASLQNQLNSLSAQQAEYLRRLRVIEAVQADGRVFLDQIKALPKDSRLSSQEQTNLFLLQLRIYGDTITGIAPASQYGDTIAGIASASQVQLSLPELNSETTVGQYQQALTTWLAALQTQKSELEAALQTFPPKIEQLQGQIQALDSERQRLDLEYQLARETLTTLRRKLDEAQIALEDSKGYASIVAYPAVPQNPAPRGTLRNTALATLLGGFLAVFGVLVWDWWRSEEEEPAPAGQETLAREPVAAVRR